MTNEPTPELLERAELSLTAAVGLKKLHSYLDDAGFTEYEELPAKMQESLCYLTSVLDRLRTKEVDEFLDSDNWKVCGVISSEKGVEGMLSEKDILDG